MRPRFLAAIVGLLSLFGCADPSAPIKTRAGKLTQDQVDAIVRKCGGPKSMAMIRGVELVIHPTRDIMANGCVLKALQATGETNLTSVHNEMHQAP
ncbi:hypothetical protein [Novosphingobium album (ex Hu et al. 2023)]|uniref:Lipoprotein n=1 Tax=Novosphingobium album (ex Hu et al. 2023) TaxID=2930093 RepID=A0ABT0B208_9SPHN|nr:hypothetical protein [Novosphingobium album (ex Hu et al. 2023)]MCJ2179093.1 hypothetical protein [Novosphingobium album (ex Hu et al. 2023)]